MPDLTGGVLGLGIAADFIAVVGAIATLFAGIPKLFEWWRAQGHHSVNDFVVSKIAGSNKDASSLLRRKDVAILDDEPDSFPLDHIRSLVRSVEILRSIRLAQTSILSRFDVLFLDIAGVVEEDRRNGGAEVLRRLKEISKTRPLVIAVSSKGFKPESNRFFQLADDVLDKPLSPVKTEEVLLSLIADKVSPTGLAKNLDAIINESGLGGNAHRKAVKRTITFLRKKKSISWLRSKVCATYGLKGADDFEQAALQLAEAMR